MAHEIIERLVINSWCGLCSHTYTKLGIEETRRVRHPEKGVERKTKLSSAKTVSIRSFFFANTVYKKKSNRSKRSSLSILS